MNKHNLTLEQQQQLKDIGINLRQTREQRHISLADTYRRANFDFPKTVKGDRR